MQKKRNPKKLSLCFELILKRPIFDGRPGMVQIHDVAQLSETVVWGIEPFALDLKGFIAMGAHASALHMHAHGAVNN